MNVSLPSFEEQRKEIELSLGRIILTQLESQAVSYEESQDMARFILAHIDDIKNSADLLIFLQTLGAKWPVFESIYGLYRLKVKDDLDTKTDIQKAQAELHALGGGV